MPAAPTSSIRFAAASFVQPRIAGSPSPNGSGLTFNGATQATLSFWLKVNALPSWGWTAPVALYSGAGMFPRVNANGTIQFDLYTADAGHGGFDQANTAAVPVNIGVADHWLAVFDGSGTGKGTLTVYRNGEPTLSTITAHDGPNSWIIYQILTLGNYLPTDYLPFAGGGDVELADVAAWNGYLGTPQDAIDLTNHDKRPSDIATPQRLIYITGDGGTIGQDVGPTDAGILNQGHSDFASNEGFTYDFRAYGGTTASSNQGSIKYSGPLSYDPPCVASPYVAASGEGIGFLFATKGGQKAHVPRTASRSDVLVAGKDLTLTITRAVGDPDVVTLDPDFAYFSNATSSDLGGKTGQDWIYFDLRAQGIDPIGPLDTARVSAARHWINLAEGYCDALDADAPVSRPVAAMPDVRPLRVGYNLEAPFLFNLPYYGNMARWMDHGRPRDSGGNLNYAMDRDPATGQWIPGTGSAGSYFEAKLLDPDAFFGLDECATRGPNKDGTGNEQHANASYDNPAYGTGGFKLGWGYRVLPRRGKIHVAWDYYPGHDGDGEVLIRLHPYDNDFGQGVSGGSTFGPQVYSWTFNPTIHAGTGGADYYRTYEYVGNDPVNGLGATGARMTPQLHLRHTGYCTNIRVTVEADADLPEAAYNVDKFDPPLFHPYLIGEVLRGVDTIRLMNWADTYDTGLSDVDQFTPYGNYTWGAAFSDAAYEQGFPLEIAITRIDPIPEPQATELRAAWAGCDGGGFPMKLTLAQPHKLSKGATCSIAWGSAVTPTGVSDQDGMTYAASLERGEPWIRAARPVSGTDDQLIWWAWFEQPGGGKPFGILSQAYTGGDLGGAKLTINRRRTLPLRAVGELAAAADCHVHYCLPLAIALDATKAAAWADAVAPYFPAGKFLYVESGNEVWNDGGAYPIQRTCLGDDLGQVGGTLPGSFACSAHNVRVTARAVKAIRQRWAAHGLDPGKVKCLINTGPGTFLPDAIPIIQELNGSGDPLQRIDEVSVNTYFGNFGQDGDDLAAFPGYTGLGIGRTLDLFELHLSRANYPVNNALGQRAQLDAAGLSDVALTSYEGGSEQLTVGFQATAPFDPNDIDNQAACAALGRLQLGVFRHPRWAGIMQTLFARLQGIGMTRLTRFVATAPPWPGYYGGLGAISRKWWTSYLSMEPSGKGDGSDGKWDNRVSDARPYAPYAEGDSVSVDAYAIKKWNAANPAARKKKPMIDWDSSWTADGTIAGISLAHAGSVTGGVIDLDSKSALELGIKVEKNAGAGRLVVVMLNAISDTEYESPPVAAVRRTIDLIPDAGTGDYRIQLDARDLSQAKPRIEAYLGNGGIYNSLPIQITSITLKYRTGVEV